MLMCRVKSDSVNTVLLLPVFGIPANGPFSEEHFYLFQRLFFPLGRLTNSSTYQ